MSYFNLSLPRGNLIYNKVSYPRTLFAPEYVGVPYLSLPRVYREPLSPIWGSVFSFKYLFVSKKGKRKKTTLKSSYRKLWKSHQTNESMNTFNSQYIRWSLGAIPLHTHAVHPSHHRCVVLMPLSLWLSVGLLRKYALRLIQYWACVLADHYRAKALQCDT